MSNLKFKKVDPAGIAGSYRVRMTLLTDMLGTKPCSSDIAQRFLQGKMNKADRMKRDLTEEDKIAKANEAAENAEKALTIFYKVDGKPTMEGYQFLGYLKEAAKTQSNDGKKLASNFYAGSLKGRIEEAFNIPENFVEIVLPEGYDPYETVVANGKETKRWKQLERPLRTEFKGATVTSVARSEVVPAGSVMEFTVELRSDTVPVSSGKQSMKVDARKLLLELLGEGTRRGLGQWRNSGHGRFEAEVAEL